MIAKMIPRRIKSTVVERLATVPAIVLLGPRQVGKTTLALHIAKELDAALQVLHHCALTAALVSEKSVV